jgi:hypothetical protein
MVDPEKCLEAVSKTSRLILRCALPPLAGSLTQDEHWLFTLSNPDEVGSVEGYGAVRFCDGFWK